MKYRSKHEEAAVATTLLIGALGDPRMAVLTAYRAGYEEGLREAIATAVGALTPETREKLFKDAKEQGLDGVLEAAVSRGSI